VTNPLHAAFYADRAVQRRVAVLENVEIARDTYRVRFACPEIAARIVPGQFMMLRLADSSDPLLGRAFALFDTVSDTAGRPWAVDIVYLVVGKMTSALAGCQAGRELEVWGPLGNGFSSQPVEHLIMVAGGIGQTPFAALAQEFLGRRTYGDPPRRVQASRRVTFCYGVRSAEYFASVDDFERFGVELRLSTDDGTRGHHGFVTDLVRQTLSESKAGCRIACCGPEPMMEAVAEIAHAAAVPCEVSLETPMACGIGICFSCVTKVRLAEGGWDYKRTCVEGPVFDAATIEW
jgi:dihydroorotate dehydrogenase electron transfer subunit